MLIHNDDQAKTTRYAGEIMSRLRPDLWPTPADASHRLTGWMNEMQLKNFGYSIGTGGFKLIKFQDGETISGYELVMHLVDWEWFDNPDNSVDFSGAIWQAQWVQSAIEETVSE